MKILSTITFVLYASFALAQTYKDAVTRASNAYDAGQYDSCSFYFKKAFVSGEATGNDLYHAATCNILNNNYNEALSLLFSAITKGINISQLKIDPDFDSLHGFPEWEKLIRTANRIQVDSFQACMYPQYAEKLAEIWESDQYIRFRLGRAYKTEDTAAQKILWAQMKKADSLNNNVQKLETIMDSIGWPTRSKVGKWGASTAFLVFDHASRDVMEKYFPLLEKAANEGEASKSNMATMKDRILVNRGKKQIYGTQSYWGNKQNKFILFPIEDSGNINRRRKEVGLEPLDDFPLRNQKP